MADFAQFTLLPRTLARETFASLGNDLMRVSGPDGTELFDSADAAQPDRDTPAPPRLLGMWDQTLLAYADRTRILPDDIRPHVCRRNGDILPTVLVDGHVAGVWRHVENGIEITPLRTWPDSTWHRLEAEAEQLRRLLVARDPSLFDRYHNWWKKLPDTNRTILGSGNPSRKQRGSTNLS